VSAHSNCTECATIFSGTKTAFGEIAHCGHVFSEMRAYNERTAKEDAIKMVEMIRAYWMEQARRLSR